VENKVAEERAKDAFGATAVAERLPCKDASITTLVHVVRRFAESKWRKALAWVTERCSPDTTANGRYYLLRKRQRTDPTASRAPKEDDCLSVLPIADGENTNREALSIAN
jgi:hypothetical protein